MTSESSEIYRGFCHCKAVSWSVSGPPLRRIFCHCTLCQRLHGAPFVHAIQYPTSQFRWTHAEPHEDHIERFNIPEKPWKYRVRCKKCGVMVVGENTKIDVLGVFGGGMERDEDGNVKHWDQVKATDHIFYDTRLMDVHDGLPKWE